MHVLFVFNIYVADAILATVFTLSCLHEISNSFAGSINLFMAPVTFSCIMLLGRTNIM
jgi:hypothetical protein